MFAPRRRDMLEDLQGVHSTPTTGQMQINYRDYASEVAVMVSFDEQDAVFAELDDLTESLAMTATSIGKGGNELAGLKNAVVCMHDVFKAYAEHHLPVPGRLTTIRQRLEDRRAELDPKAIPSNPTASEDAPTADM